MISDMATGKSFLRIINRWQSVISFILGFIILFVFSLISNIKTYYYDASGYWQLGHTFISSKGFSFLNYPKTDRGYFFPFILSISSKIGRMLFSNERIGYMLCASLFVSFVFTIALPVIFIKNKDKNYIIQSLVPIIIFLLFWQDLLIYPLSDILPLGFVVIACAIAFKIIICEKSRFKLRWLFYIVCAFIMPLIIGILLYGAYNTRTIYLFVVPVFLISFIFLNRKKGIIFLIIALIAFALGFLIPAIPQMMLNYRDYKSFSPLVISGLFTGMLGWGTLYQRYDTYVGPGNYSPAMLYLDPAGKAIMDKIGVTSFASVGQYLKAVIHYPFDFLGLYARHVINAFFLPFPKSYLAKFNYNAPFYMLFNYTLLFIASIGGLQIIKGKKFHFKYLGNPRFLMILSIMITCVLMILSIDEPRYFMPAYVIVYAFLAFICPYKKIWNSFKSKWVRYVFAYIAVLALMCTVWGSTFASLASNSLLLS